ADLLGALDVCVVEIDFHAVRELAAVKILTPQADIPGLRDAHPGTFESQVDRALLDDAVDVVPPRVVIQEAVDRQLELGVQAMQQTPHAARRLPAAMADDAIVLLPELVLGKAAPDRVLFDMQDKFRVALFELNDIWLDDRRDAVAGT